MKNFSLLATISLALSVSAVNQNFQQNGLLGGNRGSFGNNKGFFGQGSGGRNGQNSNQNGKGVNNANNNKGKQSNNNANKGGQNNGKGAAATSSAAAAASTAAAASNSSSAASNNSNDPQSSLTLDPKVIATGFQNNGQAVQEAGQVASLTSSNNFINFCLTVPNLPITNGQQITTGSCNPAPMGSIPSTSNMPSAKFVFPKNGDTSLQENTPFTVTMAVANFETGNFVNAQQNYFAAPQQLNGQGQIIGHSHIVVEQLSALDQTTPTDPRKFAFFKGLNAAAANGVLTADVTSGLPAGVYKVSSINTAANHQPVLVPIAQHGSLDDAVYFTVNAKGSGAAAAAGSASSGTASAAAAGSASSGTASAAAAAATASAAASQNNNGGAAAGAKNNGNKGNNNQGGKQQQQQKGQQNKGKGRRHARSFF